MITNISFCILNHGHSDESLERCINSIRKQAVPRYEILVCSGEGEQADVIFFHHEEWARRGEINKMRNQLCTYASNEFIVLMDANIELAPDWYNSMMQADCYDIISCRLSNPGGERVVDWAYKLKEGTIPLPLNYDEWTTKAYVSGILMVIRRSIWEQLRFNENLLLNQDDDLDFCIRASKISYRIGVFPDATAVYHIDENTFKSRKYITFKELKIAEDYKSAVAVGRIAYDNKNYDEAIKYYNKILEITPDDASILTDMGWAHYYEAQYEMALKAFNKAIRLDPTNNRAFRGRGWTYYRIGRLDKAIKDFIRVSLAFSNSYITGILSDFKLWRCR